MGASQGHAAPSRGNFPEAPPQFKGAEAPSQGCVEERFGASPPPTLSGVFSPWAHDRRRQSLARAGKAAGRSVVVQVVATRLLKTPRTGLAPSIARLACASSAVATYPS